MTTSKEQFEKAFSILSQFERQLIEASEFSWSYFTSRVTASKATLWRNVEFRFEFNRVAELVKGYKSGLAAYSLEKSKDSVKDVKIKRLEEEISGLKSELSRERERLAYAAMVARRNNIDPIMFIDESPMISARKSNKDKISSSKNAKRSKRSISEKT